MEHTSEQFDTKDPDFRGFNANATLRVPADFLPRVHVVARARGMTAASFMRAAIVEAVKRAEAERGLV